MKVVSLHRFFVKQSKLKVCRIFNHSVFTYNTNTLWCLNPKALDNGTPYHPFGTPRRGQVSLFDNRWKVEGKDVHLGIGSNGFLVCLFVLIKLSLQNMQAQTTQQHLDDA